MAAWTEQRGWTLTLATTAGDPLADRFVRLSLVQRNGLVRRGFNVHEARIELGNTRRAPTQGRLLSWRDLQECDATTLLTGRLRTFYRLGYILVTQDCSVRGTWDWLRDLVLRQIPSPEANGDMPTVSSAMTERSTALKDAIDRLGLPASALVDGLAAVFRIDAHGVEFPEPNTVARVEPDVLAIVLPLLMSHESGRLREIGARWLSVPTTLYELPASALRRWLVREPAIAGVVADRLPREGLALLGPEGLTEVAQTAPRQHVREHARNWCERLGWGIRE